MPEQATIEKPLVLSGTFGEFIDWCRAEGLRPGHDAVYIRGMRDVRGRQDPIITRVGTWWTNPLARDPAFKKLERKL